MANALLNVPGSAAPGEIVEIKVLIQHPMETGFRPRADGSLVPRDIITRLVCTYNGAEVFAADLHPAIAANPFLVFTTTATESGEITVEWTDLEGERGSTSASITVG